MGNFTNYQKVYKLIGGWWFVIKQMLIQYRLKNDRRGYCLSDLVFLMIKSC